MIKGKIVDVKFINSHYEANKLTSLASQFDIDPKLSCLSTNFKFYMVILNGIHYILGVNYLTRNSVRKIRLNMGGNILEDVVDTVLEDGSIHRVSSKNIIIIKHGKVVKAFKDYNLSPVRLSGKQMISESSENPNIGVIDFETFQYEDNTYRVYAAGFKTYLDKNTTTYYTDNKDSSDYVVLKLINELLRSKYSKTTFYCHNLGGFDVVFVLKVLVDYNESKKNNRLVCVAETYSLRIKSHILYG